MKTIHCTVPLMGICAYSGTGKTTLLRGLIPLLKGRGLRLALLKHAHHSFDIDHPGKDSYQLRKAGADQVLIASRERVALIRETPGPRREPRLAELLPTIDTNALDLILVEGFKTEPIPKIELHRPVLGHPLIHAADGHVIAVASDVPMQLARDIPRLDLNDPDGIAAFIIEHTGLARYTLSAPAVHPEDIHSHNGAAAPGEKKLVALISQGQRLGAEKSVSAATR